MKRFVMTASMAMAPAVAFAGVTKYYDIRGYLWRLIPGFVNLLPASLLLGFVVYAIYPLASRVIPSRSKFIWIGVVVSFGLLTPFFAALDPRETYGWNLIVIGGALLGLMPPLSPIILNQGPNKFSRVMLAAVMLPFSIVLTILYMWCWVFYISSVVHS